MAASAAILFLPHLLIWLLTVKLSIQCAPQPNGNCYAGTYSNGVPNFMNQRCSDTSMVRDWCTVSYQPTLNVAQFGCASSLQIPIGAPTCGDGALGVNTQGCNTINTPTGPCFLCCCKGGSCNHPRVFAEQAREALGSTNTFPLQEWNSATYINFFVPFITYLLYILFT